MSRAKLLSTMIGSFDPARRDARHVRRANSSRRQRHLLRGGSALLAHTVRKVNLLRLELVGLQQTLIESSRALDLAAQALHAHVGFGRGKLRPIVGFLLHGEFRLQRGEHSVVVRQLSDLQFEFSLEFCSGGDDVGGSGRGGSVDVVHGSGGQLGDVAVVG